MASLSLVLATLLVFGVGLRMVAGDSWLSVGNVAAVVLVAVGIAFACANREAVVQATAQVSFGVLSWARERFRAAVERLGDEIARIDRALSDLTRSDGKLTKEREAHARCLREQQDRETAVAVTNDRFRRLRRLYASERLKAEPLTQARMRSHLESLLLRKNEFGPWARLVVGEPVAALRRGSPGGLTAFVPPDARDLLVTGGFWRADTTDPIVRVISRMEDGVVVSDSAVYGENSKRDA